VHSIVDHGFGPERRLNGTEGEEYGSHDKTFEAAAAGSIRVVDARPATP